MSALLHPALRRVLVVRVRAIFREAWKKLKTPGGAFVGVLLLGLVLMPLWLRATFPGLAATSELSTWGPTGVLALWLVQIMLRGGGDVLGFEPAEADQLFAAPIPHAHLLRYKLGLLLIAWSNGGVLLAPVAAMYAGTLLGGFLAALLVLPFLQLSAMVGSLLRQGSGAPPWVRFAALGGIVMLPVMLAGGVGAGPEAVAEGVNAWARHPVGAVLLAPFVASATLLASTSTPAILRAGAIVFAVDAALALAMVWLGRRSWVEKAQSGADDMRSRLQRYRSGGLSEASGWLRIAVPRIRGLGGVGVLWWRRVVELVRRPATWLGFLGVMVLVVMLAMVMGRARASVDAVLVAGLMWSSVMLPSVLRSDFRSDLDRIDALRAMPVTAGALYFGNVLPMGLMIGGFEAAMALSLMLWQPAIALEGLAVMLVAPLWAVLVVASENTVFLFFPARMEAGEAAIGSVGRNLLSTFLGWATHGVATAVAIGVGLGVGLIGGPLSGLVGGAGVALVALGAIAGLGIWKLQRFVPPLT